MGKKARKTRWRTLSISGQRSDSEESSSNPGGPELSKSYHQPKSYYTKFPYSSQSTPTRRYPQNDSKKSTRSSSTASEHKITFNEDEYTKITTPRQDVLFKKGYLSKPKNYQLPTTGTSTGNSTGNGTPDHQSADGTEGTDLEYEQPPFLYTNGFIDHNGIYFVNAGVQNFDPYPMVIYNPTPVCYPEYPNNAKYNKRYSTDSLTESTSPNNEENNQELSQSGGETSNGGAAAAAASTEFGTVYNVLYPGYIYNNGVYPVNDIQNGQYPTELRRFKKRRRRKLSRSKANAGHDGTSDEFTDDEEFSDQSSERSSDSKRTAGIDAPTSVEKSADVVVDASDVDDDDDESDVAATINPPEAANKDAQNVLLNGLLMDAARTDVDETVQLVDSGNHDLIVVEVDGTDVDVTSCSNIKLDGDDDDDDDDDDARQSDKPKTIYRVDAEEFVPRAFRTQTAELPHQRNVNRVPLISMQPPNFVPLPLLNDHHHHHHHHHHQTFNPQFLPPAIPINFMPPPDPKLMTNFVNFVPPSQAQLVAPAADVAPPPPSPNKSDIDIAKIVSKLEEAAQEQNAKPPEAATERPSKTLAAAPKGAAAPTPNKPRYSNVANDNNRFAARPYERNYATRKIAPPPPAAHAVEYSETLKRNRGKAANQTAKSDRQLPQRKDVSRPVDASPASKTPAPKPVDRWISVQSRKKRKNGKMEEAEECSNGFDEEDNSSKEFEEYDVNLLVDVVVAAEAATATAKTVEAAQPPKQQPVAVVEVADPKTDDAKKPQAAEEQRPNKVVSAKSGGKKKQPKKFAAKQQQKRVIITDVDLSAVAETKKVEPVVAAKPTPPPQPPPEVVVADVAVVVKEEAAPAATVETVVDAAAEPPQQPTSPDKKSKKKKKKNKTVAKLSTSSVALDDSCDFLDQSGVEIDSKTNVEMSQELDRMIQRGLYANLAEKMKSLNLSTPADTFFRTVVNDNAFNILASPKESLLKYSAPAPSPAPLANGKAIEQDVQKVVGAAEAAPTKAAKPVVVKKDVGLTTYPITQAVKEWMNKKRENTPELEILKSPSEIKQQYCVDDTEDDDEEVGDSKNGTGNPLPTPPPPPPPLVDFPSATSSAGGSRVADNENGDDEVVVFSADLDLLECWEDEMTTATTNGAPIDVGSVRGNGKIEQGLDVLEVYESVYGKNADYIQLKAEVEKEAVAKRQQQQQQQQHRPRLTKHGDLPYRAICCSVM